MSEAPKCRIRRWREQCGIDADTIARLIGEHVDDYVRFERGKYADLYVRTALEIIFADKFPIKTLLSLDIDKNEDLLLERMTIAFNEALAAFERQQIA